MDKIDAPSIDDYDIVIKFRIPLSYSTIEIKPKDIETKPKGL